MKGSTPLALATGLLLTVCAAALGQETPPPDGAAKPAGPSPQQRRKPKSAGKVEEGMPKLRSGVSSEPPPKTQDEASEEPIKGMAASKPARRAPITLSIVCDPGQSVHYEGDKASIWVTRAGRVTIDNPLRPLTPDVTRVLQLVVGNRIATAFGADFLALKRGTSPAALEGVLGGAIHWDAALPTMPDTLNIVADSGASLAELPFQSCGQAPAVRGAPVAKARGTAKPAKAQAEKPAPAAAPDSRPAVAAGAPATQPRTMSIPRGAISE